MEREMLEMDTDAASHPFYAALVARDGAADGSFVYAVATTGVYCRPSCPARPPRPENVRYFESSAAASAAGFRACKRCRPEQAPQATREAACVAAACRRIETAQSRVSLAELARAAGYGTFHFHRLFKKVTGVTPLQYAAAQRAARVRAALDGERTVTAAMYEAGYNASSRFYAQAPGVLGMAPGRFRAGAAGAEIEFATAACALGHVLVGRTAAGICAIEIGDDAALLAQRFAARFGRARDLRGDAAFGATLRAVVALVEAPGTAFALPLDIAGTVFQRRVWAALREIPAGRTASYAQVAAAIGQPGAARAVAAACAANELAVAIPCHRVVRGSGALAGYRWGVERKRELLRREADGA